MPTSRAGHARERISARVRSGPSPTSCNSHSRCPSIAADRRSPPGRCAAPVEAEGLDDSLCLGIAAAVALALLVVAHDEDAGLEEGPG